MTELRAKRKPPTLFEKARDLAALIGWTVAILTACSFMVVTGWYMRDLRDAWLFDWLPF